MYGIIYCVTNIINGRKYIGQTIQSLKKRKKQHLYYNSCPLLHKKLHEYGEKNFKWEIICECSNRKELNKKEIYYINKYNTLANKNGYNLMCGSETKCIIAPSGSKHYLNKMTKEEKEKWLDTYMRGDNNIHKRSCGTEEKYQIWLDENQRGWNNPVKKGKTEEEWQKWLDEHYRGKNHYTNKMTKEEYNVWLEKQKRKTFKHTELTKKKLSKIQNESIKNKYKVIITCPDGTKYYAIGIGKFCREYSNKFNIKLLNRRELVKIAKGKKLSKYRGYWCEFYDKNQHKNYILWK